MGLAPGAERSCTAVIATSRIIAQGMHTFRYAPCVYIISTANIIQGIGQIWKSFNALFAAFINACPTMISHFVPILLDLQLPQNDLVNQIICLDSCNLAFDKSPEGAANHPTWIIRMLDKVNHKEFSLQPSTEIRVSILHLLPYYIPIMTFKKNCATRPVAPFFIWLTMFQTFSYSISRH